MIDVKCLASGSFGNSYAVDDGESVLLLEAGIQKNKILSGYADRLARVAGCLVTHEHTDHAKAAVQLTDCGIDVYASQGTLDAIRPTPTLRSYRFHTLHARKPAQVGSWAVIPWEAQHDAAEPLGFLLYSRHTKERLLFATDTYYIPNRFPQLDYIMVECNYDVSILLRNIAEGLVPESLKTRLYQSHFSLDNVRAFLTANDLRRVQHIYLLHVSGGNGDRESFGRDIKALTGIPVTVF